MQGFSLKGTLQMFNFGVNMKQSDDKVTVWLVRTILFFCLFWEPLVWAEHSVDLQINGIKDRKLDENVHIYADAIEKE